MVRLENPASTRSAAEAEGGKFIKEAIQGNLAEVKVGQLAQEKGASPGVRGPLSRAIIRAQIRAPRRWRSMSRPITPG